MKKLVKSNSFSFSKQVEEKGSGSTRCSSSLSVGENKCHFSFVDLKALFPSPKNKSSPKSYFYREFVLQKMESQELKEEWKEEESGEESEEEEEELSVPYEIEERHPLPHMFHNHSLNNSNNSNKSNKSNLHLELKPGKLLWKTLILNLSGTLIHFVSKKGGKSREDLGESVYEVGNKYFLLRNLVREFLQELSKEYEIIIFTGIKESDAQKIVGIIDPKREYISHVLSRKHCRENYTYRGVILTKGLDRIHRNPKHVFILDDLIRSWASDIDNLIPIKTFTGGEDSELAKIMKYLLLMKDVKDCREVNIQYYGLQKYIQSMIKS